MKWLERLSAPLIPPWILLLLGILALYRTLPSKLSAGLAVIAIVLLAVATLAGRRQASH